MDFNYSYRAFLITSLLTGILVLLLISIKLSNIAFENESETYDMIVLPNEISEEEQPEISSEKIKIETNRAYNEAEKFIASVENENQKVSETTEGKLEEMAKAIENSNRINGENVDLGLTKKKAKEKNYSNSRKNKQQQAIVEGGNQNTTISYRLVNRRDVYLPNPVYTCYGAGRIVINIEVDHLGQVQKGTYNKAASTSTNQCLIDAAMEYALQAEFTTDASRPEQLGTITFNFPGQG